LTRYVMQGVSLIAERRQGKMIEQRC